MAASFQFAFLRGINVGGKNKLPMKDLVAICEEAGASDVRTYIQSGNVLFRASAGEARVLSDRLAKGILERFGYRVPVITRSAAELRRVAANNPFLRAGKEPRSLHVGFLDRRPGAALVRDLDPDRSPPDEFAVLGREIYFHCPNGLARTKLTNAWFDSRLKTICTVRSHATVTKLLERV